MHDNLMNIRQLPQSILAYLHKLIVNRIGSTPDAVMLTRDIVGFVSPNQGYQLVNDEGIALKPVQHAAINIPCGHVDKHIHKPKHAVLEGTWLGQESVFIPEANILGGMGMLVLRDDNAVQIPVLEATADNLAFYNAHLLDIGDTVIFESQDCLPITEVLVGPNYVNHYLSHEEYGGGEYIEYHNQPHLWAPKNASCGGHILLGVQEKAHFYLTGFRIPFGHAVYLSPYTLHSDAYLVGDYLVVYAVAEEYSTVLFKDQKKQLKRLEFVVS